jgi:hypothetical protein
MFIKSKSPKSSILNEGNYEAKVSSIECKPDEANPKKILISFKIGNEKAGLVKQLPASFESGTMLRQDVETILARSLTETEEDKGFDLNSLIDKECQIVVMHKAGAGGKKVPAVGVILPKAVATVTQPVVAAVPQPAVHTMPVQVIAAIPQQAVPTVPQQAAA